MKETEEKTLQRVTNMLAKETDVKMKPINHIHRFAKLYLRERLAILMPTEEEMNAECSRRYGKKIRGNKSYMKSGMNWLRNKLLKGE